MAIGGWHLPFCSGGAPPAEPAFVAIGQLITGSIKIRTLTHALTLVQSGDTDSSGIIGRRAVYIDEMNKNIFYGVGNFVEQFDKDLNFIWSFNCGGDVKAIHRIGASDIVVGHNISGGVNLRRIAIGGSQVWGVDRGAANVNALDVDTNGDIIIGTNSSTAAQRLQKIDPSDGSSIWNVNSFSQVETLKVRASDNGIYVNSSSASLSLRLFNTSGTAVSGINPSGGGSIQSIEIDSSERVFAIAGSGTNRIYQFSKDLSTEIAAVGGSVTRNQIAVAPDDTVYVIGQVSSGDYLFRYNNALNTILNSFNTGADGQSVAII